MRIKLGNTDLSQVDEFVYLGGTICSDTSADRDIARRSGIAAGVARSLRNIWTVKDISKDTKVLVYRSLVLSILLYNAESRTMKTKRGL